MWVCVGLEATLEQIIVKIVNLEQFEIRQKKLLLTFVIGLRENF